MADEEQKDLGEDFENEVLGDGIEEMNEGDEEELEAMKAKLADMEKEAEKLKEMQEKAQKESGIGGESSGAPMDAATKEEVDGRSVYVGNVDYACTPEELQAHFQQCGTVNRVTILTDKGGNPKGFAYIEFLEADAVEHACILTDSELHGRQIKVQAKRTNVPGMKQRGGRGGGRGRGRGFGFMPMMPPPFMWGYGYPGYAPRGGRGGRGRGGRGGGFYAPY